MEIQTAPRRPRLWQVDALRGLALLHMLVYHGMYDWVYIFGHSSGWYNIAAPGCHAWQQYICWSFVLLSGFSFAMARKPWKNGLLVAGCALVLTAVTAAALPSQAIWFGVLHLNACAVLLTWLLRPALEKLPAAAGLAGRAALPDFSRFTSADYFPLIPWLFLFWCGFYAWRLFGRRAAARAGQSPAALRPLCAAGSHTLLLYMLHQPVIFGLLWALDAALRG